MASTYVARHQLKIGEAFRDADELVPEAATWDRLQSALTTGFVRPHDVPDEDFVAAVRRYCPELEAQLSEINGLDFADFPEPEPEEVPEVLPAAPETPVDEQVLLHEDTPSVDVAPEKVISTRPVQRPTAKKAPAKKAAAKKAAPKAPSQE